MHYRGLIALAIWPLVVSETTVNTHDECAPPAVQLLQSDIALSEALATETQRAAVAASDAEGNPKTATTLSSYGWPLKRDVEGTRGTEETQYIVADATGVQRSMKGVDGKESHIKERRLLGKFIMENASFFGDEVEQYAHRYHHQLTHAQMIFFLHVSKSAGTTLCEAGRQSGCRVTDRSITESPLDKFVSLHTGVNCNSVLDLPDYWGKFHRKHGENCSELSTIYAVQNLTLAGNENYLISEGLCRQFFNVMVVRDPMSRLMSHLSMFNINASTLTVPEVVVAFPIISNNYYIRSLLGVDVFTLPFGKITSIHLEKAKRVLEGFDLLLVVDEENKSVIDIDIEQMLGWSVDVVEPSSMRRNGDTEEFRDELKWNRIDWALVKSANALDQELWEYAKDLYKDDHQVFSHPAFKKVATTWMREDCGFIRK